MSLTLLRGGKSRTVNVTLAELKQAGAESAQPDEDDAAPDTTGFGMGVQPLTPDQASALDLPTGRGVLVASVSGDGKRCRRRPSRG